MTRSIMRHPLRLAIFMFFVTGLLMLIPVNKAEAAYEQLPDMLPESTSGYRPYFHLSYNTNDPDDGAGVYSRTTSLKLYTKTPTAKNVYLQIASGSCPSFSVNASVYQVDDKRNILGTRVQNPDRSSSGCSNIQITIPANAFTPSNETAKNQEGVWVAALRLRLITEGVAVSFRVNVDANQLRLGVMGVYPNGGEQGADAPSDAHLSNSAYSVRGGCDGDCSNPGRYNVSLAFAAPCTFFGPNPTASSSRNVSIFYKDLDSGQPINGGQPVSVSLEGTSDNGGVWGTEITEFYDSGSNLSNIREIQNVEIKYGWKYRLIFQGMDKRNGVRLWFPFDSAGSDFTCPPPLPDTGDLGPCYTTNVHFSLGSNGVNVRVYARTSNDSNPFDEPKVYDANHKATAELHLGQAVGLDQLQSNNGFWILVKPLDSSNNPSGPNTEGGPGSTHRNLGTGPCFSATCTITVYGALGGNRLPENQIFNATINIHNNSSTSRIPGAIDSVRAFGLKGTGNLGPGDFAMADPPPPWQQGYIPPGGDWNKPIQLTAGPGRNYYTVTGYPGFINRTASGGPTFDIGPTCGPTVATYQEFNMTQTVSAVADDTENPTVITGTATISRDGGATDAPLQSGTLRVYRESNNQTLATAGVPNAIAGTVPVGPAIYTNPAGVRSAGWAVGERYCASIDYNYQHGWWGPGGNADIVGGVPGSADGCERVINRPYVSVYGNDVSAGGGGLGQPCSTAQSNISAYSKQGGSGTQLAAYANGNITQFKTAFLRSPSAIPNPINAEYGAFPTLGTPTLPDGLKFASYGAVDCATDYYTIDQFEDGDTRKKAFNGSTLNVGAPGLMQNGEQTVSTPPGGQLRLNGSTNFTGKHTIFVDGDVYITSNITYASTSWANIDAIPYFNLVVKGNIYIDPNVTQLDGRFIAQKRNDDVASKPTGIIYTCAPSGDASPSGVAGGYLWNNCGGAYMTNPASPGRKLTVNGQFIARAVAFRRTINTLSDGTFKERQTTSKAAEIFNFSPEMYLARPAVRPTATSTSGEYEYITTLPPIL